MGHHIASVSFSSAAAGPVFALVHPGGLLTGPARIAHLGIEALQDIEVRIRFARYDTKASSGSKLTTSPMLDGAGSSLCEVRTGNVAWPAGTPNLTAPARCCTRGPRASDSPFESGNFTLAPNHTLVIETLDAVPSAASYPLTFVIAWEE